MKPLTSGERLAGKCALIFFYWLAVALLLRCEAPEVIYAAAFIVALAATLITAGGNKKPQQERGIWTNRFGKSASAAALAVIIQSSNAATNTVSFDLAAGGDTTAVAYKMVRIAPSSSSFPRAEGPVVVGVDYGFKVTDSLGRFTNTMVTGTYDITFTNRFRPTTFQITVPATNYNGVLTAAELTTSGTNLPSNMSAYSQAASDGRFNLVISIRTNSTEVYRNPTQLNLVGFTGYVSGATVTLGSTNAGGSGANVAQGTNVVTTTNAGTVTVNATVSQGFVTDNVSAASNALRTDVANLQGATNGLTAGIVAATNNATGSGYLVRSNAPTLFNATLNGTTTISTGAFTELQLGSIAFSNPPSWVTVKDYGATGDGVTDDTSAFTNMLARQGRILVPAGTNNYLLKQIVLTNYQSIEGIGGRAKLTLHASVSGYAISTFGAIGTQVKNLSMFGTNLADYSATASAGGRGGIHSGRAATIENVFTHGFTAWGVYVQASSGGLRDRRGTLQNVICSSNWGGIYMEDEYLDAINVAADHCRIGLRTDSGNSTFTGGQVTDSGYGLYLSGSGNNGHGIATSLKLNHCTYPFYASGVNFGFVLNGLSMFGGGHVWITNSYGLDFNACAFSVTGFRFSGGSESGTNYIRNSWITGSPTFEPSYGSSAGIVVYQNVTRRDNATEPPPVSAYQGTNVFVNASPKVGINTNTPGYELDVLGTVNSTSGLRINGTARIGALGQFWAVDGSADQPGFSFADDLDTGVYRVGANFLGLSTFGTNRVIITPTGDVGIATNTPAARLHVNGHTRVEGGTTNTGPMLANDYHAGDGSQGLSGNLPFGGVAKDGLITTIPSVAYDFPSRVSSRVAMGLPINISVFGDSIATFFTTAGPERLFTNQIAFQGGTATANINNWVSYSLTNASVITAIDPRWLQLGGPWYGIFILGTNSAGGGTVVWSSTLSNATLRANSFSFDYWNGPGQGTLTPYVQTNGAGSWVSLGTYDASAGTSNQWLHVHIPLTIGNYRYKIDASTTNAVANFEIKSTNAAGFTWANRAVGSLDIVNVVTNGAHTVGGVQYANLSNTLYHVDADIVVNVWGDVWSSVTNFPTYWTNVVKRAAPNGDSYILNVWPQRSVGNELGARQQNSFLRQHANSWRAVYVDMHSHFQSSNLIDTLSWYLSNDGIHPATGAAYEGFDYFSRSTGWHPFITNYSSMFTFQQPQIRIGAGAAATNFNQGVLVVELP